MNSTMRTILIVLAVTALAAGLFLAGNAFGREQNQASGVWGISMPGAGPGWFHHSDGRGYGPMMGDQATAPSFYGLRKNYAAGGTG